VIRRSKRASSGLLAGSIFCGVGVKTVRVTAWVDVGNGAGAVGAGTVVVASKLNWATGLQAESARKAAVKLLIFKNCLRFIVVIGFPFYP
jgi:hypothetical protein